NVFRDLRTSNVDILTVGQYLQPDDRHLPIVRYWHPDEFEELGQAAREMGFAHVESGPLVRSSYHAEEQTAAARAASRLVPADTIEVLPARANRPFPSAAAPAP